jgi:hypothetical protein
MSTVPEIKSFFQLFKTGKVSDTIEQPDVEEENNEDEL